VATQVSDCPNCREPKPPHRACPHCGYYRGRQIRPVDEA
jgi:large subunit ribosomal protein L32